MATMCSQLKLPASDGKMRKTDVATAKKLLRIIQSIPSPNAEPFKQWMAQLGQDRLDEIADPEIAIERAVATYREKGYGEEWITQRLRGIEKKCIPNNIQTNTILRTNILQQQHCHSIQFHHHFSMIMMRMKNYWPDWNQSNRKCWLVLE